MERNYIPLVGITMLILAVFLHTACHKENVNPYDELEEEQNNIDSTVMLDPSSFGALHAYIFKPTCANSGCHDGNFEPDFRTIESSYNTLVNHPIIKNDPQGSYQLRVVPGNPDASVLMARLTFDIDGNSGVMPLVIEPDSDWEQTSETHIQNVRKWIQDGAKDVFGNSP